MLPIRPFTLDIQILTLRQNVSGLVSEFKGKFGSDSTQPPGVGVSQGCSGEILFERKQVHMWSDVIHGRRVRLEGEVYSRAESPTSNNLTDPLPEETSMKSGWSAPGSFVNMETPRRGRHYTPTCEILNVPASGPKSGLTERRNPQNL